MSKSRYLPPKQTPRNTPRVAMQKDELDLDRDIHEQHLDEQYVDEGLTDYEPYQLDAPPPRPGYVQRWVRVLVDGRQDINVIQSGREGWRPRKEALPKNFQPMDFRLGEKEGGPVDYLQVGDLVLMEKPISRHLERMDYYARKDAKMSEAIDQELNDIQHPSHPIHRNRRTQVTGGRRNVPNVKVTRPDVEEDDDDLDNY